MKNIFKGSIAFLLILLITGCSKEEWMNPVPETSLSDLSVFDNKVRVVAQVNGIYASLKSGQHLGGRFLVYNDVRCENFLPNSSNLVTCYATWNHSVISSTNEVQNLWGAVYSTINVVNVFLEGLDAAWADGKLTDEITEAEYKQYKSEALTVRALCYFNLLQLYSKPYQMGNGSNGGVPLRLKAMKSAADNDLEKSSVAEVYTQILKDLNDAEGMAVSDHGNATLNITRVHKNTIIALKTRVYLHMGNWASVVTESGKIVPAAAPFNASSGVAHKLNDSYAGLFAIPHATAEHILSLPSTSSNNAGTQNNLAHYFNSGSDESYYLTSGTGSVYEKMNADDARKKMLAEKSGKWYLTKYTDRSTRTDNVPVIRWAEVLLNRAEALVRQGGTVTQAAVDLLNAVRTRSYPAGAYTLGSFANAAAFYDAVLLERNIEFLGEGLRNLDVMRLNLTIPAKDGGSFGKVAEVAPTSPSYFWPTPDSELSYNKALTPNN